MGILFSLERCTASRFGTDFSQRIYLHLHIDSGQGDAYLLQVGIRSRPGMQLRVHLEPGLVQLNGDGPLFNNVSLSGEKAMVDYDTCTKAIKIDPVHKNQDAVFRKIKEFVEKKDSVGLANLRGTITNVDSVDMVNTRKWIDDHPSSPINAFLLYYELQELSIDDKEAIFSKFAPGAFNNCIARDQLTWTHVSELKCWNNAVARLYDVNAIPANFLISPDGRIMAKDLHDDALLQKLEELFPPATTAPANRP